MKAMNDNQTTAPSDLLSDIRAFERHLIKKVRSAGLQSMIIDDRMSVQPSATAPSEAATLSFLFKAGHGMEHLLMSIVTRDDLDTSERRDELADNFFLHMKSAAARAPESAASRRAIAAAAAVVIEEAAAEGIDMELLHLQPSTIHVYGRPEAEDERAQVFYVHIVMPHLDGATLTRDSYTIDAYDAEEFAYYVRTRTVPELRELLAAHSSLDPAA